MAVLIPYLGIRGGLYINEHISDEQLGDLGHILQSSYNKIVACLPFNNFETIEPILRSRTV